MFLLAPQVGEIQGGGGVPLLAVSIGGGYREGEEIGIFPLLIGFFAYFLTIKKV